MALVIGMGAWITSCGESKSCPEVKDVTHGKVTIYLVPLDGVKDAEVKKLQKELGENIDRIQTENVEKIQGDVEARVEILPRMETPDSCYNDAHTRFRAPKILNFLKKQYAGEIGQGGSVIGVTNKDISTTAHGYNDYGIQGLSNMPGAVSVISTFRVRDRNFLWRLAFHEFCHGYFGMPHCPEKDPACLMKDAEGKNPHFELKETLCDTCLKKFKPRP